ncbi:hypothetical protein JOD02_000707 [Caldicoprobacter guelmensis]|uniref:DUF4914 family protein n=1 Tax=Caldicoprobacter guelmensis TaxID=1170224 RepID=UPI00195B3A9F|nr:DUF4914 family protein [Caldicoprobacter guelmensis]MBM7581870.1 hypothetical protein [Caldicoprobacter guelmensis]
MGNEVLTKFILNDDLKYVLSEKEVIIPDSRDELIELALGNQENSVFEVAYDVPGKGRIVEATVVRCKNGAVVNYTDAYMRRRDPDCMVVADDGDTDKPRYRDRYGEDFSTLRQLTFEWLKGQNLIFMPFMAGGEEYGYPALLVAPDNAGFFAAGLADLQGFIPRHRIPDQFKPRAIIYLAPPFRHTHFGGKQIVVHNRLNELHELFSYNLYPGPSAKKGIYGVLLNIGEQEGWVTLHASTVRALTPYDNIITIMHEGASGGGKSEMIERLHRQPDGSILLGENLKTGEKLFIELKDECELQPVTDDMALCHPSFQDGNKKLIVKDAEQGWFLRINHITQYGTDPLYEKITIHPPEPLIFLNLYGVPGATCLIWEHTMDAPGKPCPNPRVIMPRRFVPGVIDDPVEIDIRSFGIRTPACTKEKPTYGIIGLFHILPPALAWLWRLVAPRGHDNPSITDTVGMSSEGVGSYWPFATGKMVNHANILLRQIVATPNTRYILVPNQHIGAYRVGFMPQWITREYLARRGSARFKPDQLVESRCALLGYALKAVKVEGKYIPKGLLEVNHQPEVGDEGYDAGAKILSDFFKRELAKFVTPELDPLGKKIIDCCMSDGTLKEYMELIPMRM